MNVRSIRFIFAVAVFASGACAPPEQGVLARADAPVASTEAFLDTLQERTFRWFWETTTEDRGLTPDRWPSRPFSSIAAVGFALTAYPVGIERGWITREQGRERTLATLRFFHEAPQGPDSTGMTGHHGFFYHFLNMETGLRHATTELSSIDSSLLFAGMLFAAAYFDGEDAAETEIRALADSIYARADWSYFQPQAPRVTMGWRPERGFGPATWNGYNEALILQVLALGSPTHPVGTETYEEWMSTYQWAEFMGQEHVNFPPLFGHQYSHVWIDFRGIQDAYMRERGIDYFENSRRATLAQRQYAIENPENWVGYGEDVWGLTASDGPARDTTVLVNGVERRFRAYWARGAASQAIRDDGTIAPTAVGGSVPFAPEVTIPALMAMRERFGDALFAEYGFLDAFNLTVPEGVVLARGRMVPDLGWVDDDYLGIDQGPILLMIENHRTGLVWDVMKRSPHIVRGLCRAGFAGGWLEGRCD